MTQSPAHRPPHHHARTRSRGLRAAGRVHRRCRRRARNLAFDSYRKTGDDRSYVLLERYVSREAPAEHRSAPHFTQVLLGQIVPLLESHTVEEYDVPE